MFVLSTLRPRRQEAAVRATVDGAARRVELGVLAERLARERRAVKPRPEWPSRWRVSAVE